MRKSAERYNYIYHCSICMERKTADEMFRSINCGHKYSFCVDCIGKYVAAKVGENVVNVRCPNHSHCHGVLTPKNCRSVLPEEVIDRWEATICKNHLASTQNLIHCPFKDCSAPLVVDGGKKKAAMITSAECPHCHRLLCAQCQIPWHAGSKCRSIEGVLKRNKNVKEMDSKFRGLAKVEKWKRCPNCKFYVEKSCGCEHIRCRCGHNFCYICRRRWNQGHTCPTSFLKKTTDRIRYIIINFRNKSV